jgi:hypothetical protein
LLEVLGMYARSELLTPTIIPVGIVTVQYKVEVKAINI